MTEVSRWCSPESPCELDSAPYIRGNRWAEILICCTKCEEIWWRYKSPRVRLAEQEKERTQ